MTTRVSLATTWSATHIGAIKRGGTCGAVLDAVGESSEDAQVIDRTGQWWTGEDFADLAEYLRVMTAEATRPTASCSRSAAVVERPIACELTRSKASPSEAV